MTKGHWSNALFVGVLFLLVCIPFYRVGFPLWIGVVLTAIGAFGLAIKGQRSSSPVTFVYLVTAFFLVEFIWIFFVEDQQNAAKNLLVKSSLLVVPLSLLAVKHGFTKRHFHILFGSFFLSSIASGIVHLIFSIRQTIEKNRLLIFYQDLSQWVHPGYYGILIAIAIIVGLAVNYDDSSFLRFASKWVKPLGVLFLIVILFLLSARMQLIAMICILLFYGVTFLARKTSRQKAILYSIMIMFLAASSSAVLVKHNKRIRILYDEFYDLSMEPGQYLNSVETRLILWGFGIETAMESPILGHGTASTKRLIVQKASVIGHPQIVEKNMGVHNELLDAWITKGILGVFLVFIMLIQPFYHAVKNQNHFLVSIVILFGLSFLTESALEREMGVILFSTFVPLAMVYHQLKENARS